jgi:hypothetical protein
MESIKMMMRFEVFTAMKIQVFWVVTLCGDVGYHSFGGPSYEDGGSMILRSVDFLLRHNPQD